MKKILLFIPLLFLIVANSQAQPLADEQWRFVDLFTTLPFQGIGSSVSGQSDEAYFKESIKDGAIHPIQKDFSGISIFLQKPSGESIKGEIRNGNSDTLIMNINTGFLTDFVTEVEINGKWFPFQTCSPIACGAPTYGKILPHYAAGIELGNSTNGTVRLPFRLKLKINKQVYYSNTIQVSCTSEQMKMAQKPITAFK